MRAPFQNGPLQGDIIFRRVEGRADTTISVDLYRIDNGSLDSMNHSWNLRVGAPDENGNCGTLGHVSIKFPIPHEPALIRSLQTGVDRVLRDGYILRICKTTVDSPSSHLECLRM